MGHRLSRIVTRTGDAGQTGLGNGLRVDKDSPPVDVLGHIDELNSWIGVLGTFSPSDAVKESLVLVQHDLFDLGAQISVPGTPLLSPEHVSRLDDIFEKLNAELPPLKEFILPGGTQLAAFTHVARTVCRRAERRLVTLSELDPLSESYGIPYLNRLSDLLFTIARYENRYSGQTDVLWERGRSLSKTQAA
jgi:cob(I)alamin adenosyltransferase